MEKKFNTELSLGEVLTLVDYKAHVVASEKTFNEKGNVINKITAKSLVSGEFPVIAEFYNGDEPSSFHFRIFSNGFCLFEAEDRQTVFDVVEYVLKKEGFTYQFEKEIVNVPSKQKLSINQLLMLNWIFALISYAETRISNNLMNDSASRLGKNANEYDNSDDGAFMGSPENFADKHAVDPVEAVIYKECVEESLNVLKDKQKTVFKSAVIEERTDLEVSNMLGIDRTAVTKRKNRALRNIRNSHIWD